MAIDIARRIAEQVLQQKLNYYQKTLTDDAIYQNLSTMYDVFDLTSFFTDITLSDTLFSSLMSYFMFDLNLNDIIPINLNWEIELPTVDEFLQGVLIKLIPISLQDLAPELSDILYDPSLLLTPEARDAMLSTKLEKCIYGKSTYGNCYVDPVNVREFLRSTVFAFMKKWYDIRSARKMVEASAKALGIKEDVVEDIFNRMSKITHAKYTCLTWDYGWWDLTYWCEEESHSEPVGALTYVNYDLQVAKSEYEGLFDAQAGCIWDESFWDMCFWGGDTPETKNPYILRDTRITQLQDKVLSNFRNRISTTAFAVGNYQTYEERRNPAINQRLDIYAQHRSHVIHIESIVENIVRSIQPDIDSVKLRLYKDASLEIYGLSSPHKWGLDMQKAMTPDEYKQYWLDKWTGMGLDQNILNMIWDSVYTSIKTYTDIRTRNRLEFLRRKLRVSR